MPKLATVALHSCILLLSFHSACDLSNSGGFHAIKATKGRSLGGVYICVYIFMLLFVCMLIPHTHSTKKDSFEGVIISLLRLETLEASWPSSRQACRGRALHAPGQVGDVSISASNASSSALCFAPAEAQSDAQLDMRKHRSWLCCT